MIEPNNAAINPSTSKPGTRYAVNINNRALITNVNNPNENTFIGRVINVKIGFKETLIILIAAAAINAEK